MASWVWPGAPAPKWAVISVIEGNASASRRIRAGEAYDSFSPCESTGNFSGATRSNNR